ncbi:MAG: T9SS type A sorting domain-containing protein [Bacteroidia bacterium]
MKTFTKNVLLCFSLFTFSFSLIHAQVQIINTIAGNGSNGYSGDGGAATAAELSFPAGIVIDGSGNVYIADNRNNCIRKINTSGIISTVAGNGTGGYGGDGGAATAAELNYPTGIAVDAFGSMYIADNGNRRIRMVSTSGIIRTVAGGSGNPDTNGQATMAALNVPYDVVVDATGNIFIADAGDNRILKVNTSGFISSVAGNGLSGYNGDGIAATTAEFNGPWGLTVDDSDNIYIADCYNNRVRKVNSAGIISTVAGGGSSGLGDGGPATSAEVSPRGITLDNSGNMYIADWNHRIRKVSTAGIINTIAGDGACCFSGDGGPATTAELQSLEVAVNVSGNIFLSDSGNNRIREVYTVYPPKANFAAVDSNVCSGGMVQFIDESDSTLTYKPANWKWAFAGGTPDTSSARNPTVDYNTPGKYTVKLVVTNAAGSDSLTKTAYITVNPTPTVSVSASSTTVCPGESALLTANGALTYSWSNGLGTGSGITVFPMVTSCFTVTGTNSFGCSDTATICLTVPTIQTGHDTAITCGNTIQLNAVCTPSASSIVWSPSAYLNNANIVNPICKLEGKQVNYIVTATITGCTVKNSITITPQAVATNISLCEASVDTGSQFNILVWDTNNMQHVDSIRIYYLNSSLQWASIGEVPYRGKEYFEDKVNNPNVSTVRYKLVSVDSCGDTLSSIWHNAMWIQNNAGTFSWPGTGYLIEGNPTPVLTYILYRDSISNGNWDSIASVNGLQNIISDPNYANYPKGRWFVEAILDVSGCPLPYIRPEKVNNTTTRSNTQHNTIIKGVQQLVNVEGLKVYPNPANETLNIRFDGTKAEAARISIVDVTGREVHSELSMVNGEWSMNIANLSTGIYFVKVTTHTSSQVVKFVKL